MTPTLYASIIMGLLVVGAGFGGAFLIRHRPRQWRRLVALDAAGWVWIVVLWYVRSIVLLAMRWPGSGPRSWVDGSVALGLLALLDVLLVVRFVVFSRFVSTGRHRERSLDEKS